MDKVAGPACGCHTSTYAPEKPEVTQAMKDAVSTREEYHGILKDSGMRVKFSTGAVRDTPQGKGRFDLLPMFSILQYAKHLEQGALKYADRNWEKGIPLSRFIDSAMRHGAKLMMGMRDEPHAAAWMWNIGGFMWTAHEIYCGRLPRELDDGNYLTAGQDIKFPAWGYWSEGE